MSILTKYQYNGFYLENVDFLCVLVGILVLFLVIKLMKRFDGVPFFGLLVIVVSVVFHALIKYQVFIPIL